MANVQYTFYFGPNQKETYNLPYIGDITDWENANIGIQSWVSGLGSDSGDGMVTKYTPNIISAGRRNINMLLSEGGSSYFLAIDGNMNKGFQVAYETHPTLGYATQVYSVYTGKVNVRLTSQYSTRYNWGKPEAITLGICTYNGITTLCLICTGESSNYGPGTIVHTSVNANSAMRAIYENTEHKGDPFNPYGTGGYNNKPKGGDDSNFSEDSDLVPIGDLPDETISAIGSGFSTLFAPTKAQLRHLQGVMWGDSIVNFFQNMVENIGSMFVSLGIVPFNVPKGNTVSVKWFGLVDTAISLTLAAQQWIRVDMGSVVVGAENDKIFTTDTALDYTPYCKLGIYLPFIGFQDLDIDECRKAPLHLYYDIDLMSGACIAKIEVAGSILYQFSGNCLSQIPLSSQDAQTLFTNAVNIGLAVSGVGTTAAVAGAGDAVAAGESLSASEASLGEAKRAAQVSSAESKLASCTANAAIGMKPNYTRTGAVGGPCAMLAEKTPYLYLRTSRQSMPEGYEKVCGFPCNMYGNLSTFSGYTVVEDIRLNHLVATAGEVEEIYKLLKSGVII